MRGPPRAVDARAPTSACLATALLCLLVGPGAAAAESAWHQVRFDASDATIEFPAKPKMERLRDAGRMSDRVAYTVARRGYYLRASRHKLDAKLLNEHSTKAILTEFRDAGASGVGAVSSESFFERGAILFLDSDIYTVDSDGRDLLRVRMAIDKGYIYMLQVESEHRWSAAFSSVASRFFDSLSLQ